MEIHSSNRPEGPNYLTMRALKNIDDATASNSHNTMEEGGAIPHQTNLKTYQHENLQADDGAPASEPFNPSISITAKEKFSQEDVRALLKEYIGLGEYAKL